MKNAICKGGCKKGDCNGDCKRSAIRKKSGVKAIPVSKVPERENIGYNLQFDLLGAAVKKARKEKHLNQKELGLLTGVGKSQISKIEKRLEVARFDSIIRVFKVLNMKVNFNIELPVLKKKLFPNKETFIFNERLNSQ